jgi:hypothetical protein
MAFVIADRVRETTTTTGTGTITLGGAVTNFETFAANLSNSDTTYYAIVDNTNSDFEVGVGTFTASGTTLARSVLASSNSNNLVDFGAGTKDVFITVPASKIVVEDGSNNVAIGGTVTASAFSGSGAGLTGVDVVSDTTPQLGGDLDAQNKDIENVGLIESKAEAGIYGSSSSPVEFTVTVASKTSGHPYPSGGSSSGNAYFINGIESPAITLHGVDSTTSNSEYHYRFTLSSSDMSSHPFRLYLDAAKNTAYTTGVTTTSTYLQIAVTKDTPKILYYQCSSHGYMGNYAIVLGSTNLGDLSVDSISPRPTGTDINVAVSDNSATAFTIKQGSDNYLVVDTGNGGESVAIGTGVSGTAISLGHSTSETTVNDNLTVTGDLTVSGTTTTVDTTNTTIKDSLLELNSGATSNSNDCGIVIERGSTGDNAILMWDESADTFVVGTTTATGASTGNLTVTDGALQAGSLDISGDVDVDGTLEADAMTLNGTTITTTATLSTGISNGNVLVANANIVDNDFLRVDGTSIEGRSASELATDIGAATTDDIIALSIALG